MTGLLEECLQPLQLSDIKHEELPNDSRSFSDEDVNECELTSELASEWAFNPANCDDHFICDICSANFKSKSGLSSHIAKHVRDDLCSPRKLTNVQSQSRLFSCPVENCNKSYSKGYRLRRHANSVHPKVDGERTVKTPSEKREKLFCPKCPKWFGIQERLDGHVRRFHEGLKVSFI